jgi:hypothetical protein
LVATEFKNRHCDVYFPSEKDLERWENIAKQTGISLSKFIYETVELHLDGEQARPRSDMAKELAQLREEIRKLRDELKLKSLVLEKYETELFKLRHENFIHPDFQGKRQFSEELVELLQRGGTWNGQQILEALSIDPKNSDIVRIVSKQLGTLQDFGLIKEEPHGWKWIA